MRSFWSNYALFFGTRLSYINNYVSLCVLFNSNINEPNDNNIDDDDDDDVPFDVASISTGADEKSIDSRGGGSTGATLFETWPIPFEQPTTLPSHPHQRRLRPDASYKRLSASRADFSLSRGTGNAVVVARVVANHPLRGRYSHHDASRFRLARAKERDKERASEKSSSFPPFPPPVIAISQAASSSTSATTLLLLDDQRTLI